ncbi:polyprenyl synthetase family protein [Falsihalocynthiibacter sp. SS001]|uniref:polyprenyl synthetase family protein n=1 Tax=Falsihalocynthiibacter sp. SS001 TaxID=3349698 RepID=UPI0036D39BF4
MFQNALAQAADEVSACLEQALANYPDIALTHGMRYAVSGGKRLRAFLVVEGARLYGVYPRQSIWAAAAVEALHAYSLVHDDLPCMDDDDLRRGQPTVHVKWDEATAVLVGDALQSFAFELLARKECSPNTETRIELIQSLAKAAGGQGMVLGQVQDIAAETAKVPLRLEQIIELQANKTGALIQWSAMAGPILAGQDVSSLRQYAAALGLAFQIADDIMDVEGDAAKAGKRLNKDKDAGKATFVSILGLDEAKKRSRELIDEAEAALAPFGDKAQNLREAARFVIARES